MVLGNKISIKIRKVTAKLGFIFFLFLNFKSFSQIPFENGIWMPQKFIAETEKNPWDCKNEKYLNPITEIVIQNNKIFLKTYRDELKPTKFKKLSEKEFLLKGVMIGLASNGVLFRDTNQIKYSEDQYYLYQVRKNMMLLIIRNKLNHDDTMRFSNRVNGDRIIADGLVAFQLRLTSKFNLYSPEKKIIEQNVTINQHGKTVGSTLINMLTLKADPPPYTGSNESYANGELEFVSLKKQSVILKFDNSHDISIYSVKDGQKYKLLYFLTNKN